MQLQDLKPSFSELTWEQKRELVSRIRENRLKVKVKAKIKKKSKPKKLLTFLTNEELKAEAERIKALLKEMEEKR